MPRGVPRTLTRDEWRAVADARRDRQLNALFARQRAQAQRPDEPAAVDQSLRSGTLITAGNGRPIHPDMAAAERRLDRLMARLRTGRLVEKGDA